MLAESICDQVRGLARPSAQHEHEHDKGIDSAPPPRSVACAAMAVVEQRSAACAAAPCRRAAWACGGVPFLGHERWLLEWQEMSEPPLAGRWQIGSDERLRTFRRHNGSPCRTLAARRDREGSVTTEAIASALSELRAAPVLAIPRWSELPTSEPWREGPMMAGWLAQHLAAA